MYAAFSADYDHFVDWPERLSVELPFIERQLQGVNAHRVLDAACGTGQHALALARRGYAAAGADLSPEMIARAKENAARAGVDVPFAAAGFGELARAFEGQVFDAVLCLGNSLPHVLAHDALAAALADFACCLRPGGLLLIQNRNFDAVLARRLRWMEPQAAREGETEWLFLRFYDFDPDERLTFNVVTLRREGRGHWGQTVAATRLWPLQQAELLGSLARAKFADAASYGQMADAPFDARASGNLVVTARRAA